MGDDQWQVAGGAAQVYERELVPAIFQPWAPRVLALAAPAASERVLDAACGTGVVARLAAERVGPDGHVVGLDLNPGMPARGRPPQVAVLAPALRKRREGVTSWNDRRIDRPPLPERSPLLHVTAPALFPSWPAGVQAVTVRQ